jgi:hypothetical protein
VFEKNRKLLISFVKQYLALPGSGSGKAQRGISLIYLALMLLARKGEPGFSESLKALGIDGVDAGAAAIADIARQTAADQS